MKTLDLIRNAKDGSYVDFRTADNQIDSVPINEIRAAMECPECKLKQHRRARTDAKYCNNTATVTTEA